MSTAEVAPANVIITAKRLAELERLEKEMPTIIAKAKEEANHERFLKLREHDKEHPDKHSKRTLKWYETHKEEINARRREKYKQKKTVAAAEAAKSPGV